MTALSRFFFEDHFQSGLICSSKLLSAFFTFHYFQTLSFADLVDHNFQPSCVYGRCLLGLMEIAERFNH